MNVNAVARIASLIGEPARTTMLLELMDGRAMTAGELARAARISPATASRHLALMTEAKLLHAAATGRHRYLRIASPEVASLLERMLQFASQSAAGSQRIQTGPTDASLRRARTCYDHLAGRLGVAIAERLAESGAIAIEPDALRVTERMGDALTALGIEGASDAGRAPHLPTVHGLERATHPPRGPSRHGNLPTLSGARLADAKAGRARHRHHAIRSDCAARLARARALE